MSKLLKESLRKTVAGIVAFATILSLSGVLALAPVAKAAVTIADGALIKSNAVNSDGTPTYASLDVYIVKLVGAKKFKRLMLNPQVLSSYGHLAGATVNVVDQATMDSYTTSGLVRVDTDPAQKVFGLAPNGDIGAKSWINTTTADFLAAGADPESVYTINSVDGGNYTAVSDVTTIAQVQSFLTTGTLPGAVVTPGTPLTVSLASDTPVGGNILAGSANGVVTKVVFTGSSTADTSITGLTVKSYGTALLNAADIANVKIFDGVTQLGLTQTQVNGVSTFTFAPAINIPMGTSKTLGIAVTLAAGATPSATVKMGIESAAKIMGTTFGGTFPIIGNPSTIVAGGALGTVAVTLGAPAPVTNTYVGAKNVVLGNFVVTAGTNEDVVVTQFNVYHGGAAAADTIQDTDVTNVRLMVAGAQVGNSANFSTRRAVINLTTPITITKGTSQSFQAVGDVASGATRVIELETGVGSVVGHGAVSGVGVTGPAASLALANSIIGIATGTLAVSVSTDSPSGAAAQTVRSVTPQILGIYDIRAVGEDMLVNTVYLNFNSGLNAGTLAGTIDNVGLYDATGSLLSNQVTLTADNTTNPDQWTSGIAGVMINTFSLNWLVPANTTQKLYIKGSTGNVTGPAGGAISITNLIDGNAALGGNQTIISTGMSSSGTAGPNNIVSNSVLALPGITILQAGTYAAVGDPSLTPRNQAVLGGAAQVTIGTIRVTAQNEDQTFRAAALVGIAGAGAGTTNAFVSGIALFDGNTQITNYVATGYDVASGCVVGSAGLVGTVANDVFCIRTADVITPVDFTKNVTKTLTVKANVLAAAANTLRLQIGLAAPDGAAATLDGLQTVGKNSGQVAENAAAVDLRTNSGGLGANTGGVLTGAATVVGVVKSATSASGSVARNSDAKLATWDLSASGAADPALASIKFTSLTGGLTGAGIAATDFKLYDEVNGVYLAATADAGTFAADLAANQVTFTVAIPVTRATGAKLSLVVNTTSLTKFAAGTTLQWAVRQAADITGATAGITSSTFISIPATANSVTLP